MSKVDILKKLNKFRPTNKKVVFYFVALILSVSIVGTLFLMNIEKKNSLNANDCKDLLSTISKNADEGVSPDVDKGLSESLSKVKDGCTDEELKGEDNGVYNKFIINYNNAAALYRQGDKNQAKLEAEQGLSNYEKLSDEQKNADEIKYKHQNIQYIKDGVY